MPGEKRSGQHLGFQVMHPTAESRSHAFRELEIVRLTQDFRSPVGVIPGGTEATILQVFDNGRAYQVEFEGPYEAPETVPAVHRLLDCSDR